jgi:hypothetical protein
MVNVLARQVDRVVGELEADLGQREVSTFNGFLEHSPAIALIAEVNVALWWWSRSTARDNQTFFCFHFKFIPVFASSRRSTTRSSRPPGVSDPNQ